MSPSSASRPPRLPARRFDRAGLYVHFPFCIQKCDYCDFYSLPLEGARKVEAPFFKKFRTGLEREYRARLAGFENRTFDTIYFGGGTSSLMPPDFVAELLEMFRERGSFAPAHEIEITLEGNPENFSPEYLEGLAEIGVTRVNTGIQTFQREALENLNRYFDPLRYRSVLADLDACSIPHVGADLIYGLPGQTAEAFYDDLTLLLGTRVDHLSLYSLTAESGTAYANRLRDGTASAPEEELQERLFRELPDMLAHRGFVQYEISNFARPDAFCRHNLRYWYYEPYLGLGPGAHGFDGRLRYGNARNLEKWLADPLHAKPEVHQPKVDVPLNLLRLTLPIPLALIDEIGSEIEAASAPGPGIGADFAAVFREQLKIWIDRGLAREVRLDGTDEGAGREIDAFQWTATGLLQLDDRVFELSDRLEKTSSSAPAT